MGCGSDRVATRIRPYQFLLSEAECRRTGPDRTRQLYEHNPEESPLISFEGDTRCSRIETTPGEFSLSLNVSEGNDALIRLKQTRLRGAIAVGDDGLTVTDAHLGGYLTRESVSQLLGDLQAICSAPNAPDFCCIVLFMNNPDGVVNTLWVAMTVLARTVRLMANAESERATLSAFAY